MNKIISNSILTLFYIFIFCGSGFLLMLANNDMDGFWGFPVIAFSYAGYYLLLKIYPNNELYNSADFNTFIKFSFIIQLVMGILLAFSLLQDQNISKLQHSNNLQIQKNKNFIKIIVLSFLFLPWIIRKMSLKNNKESLINNDSE